MGLRNLIAVLGAHPMNYKGRSLLRMPAAALLDPGDSLGQKSRGLDCPFIGLGDPKLLNPKPLNS